MALIAGTLARIADEIRTLSRSETGEMEEPFHMGKIGSSTMPHKRNPITSEQLSGLSRLVRSNLNAAMENNPLWHERDISHSSVERIILPDTTILINYMLNKMISLIENLLVYPENMRKNLELTNGLIFSQTLLLELAKKGISREKAYEIVQRNAMICWQTKQPFRDLIANDEEVINLFSPEELENIFSYDRFTKNIDYIFQRTGL
jgi:adenylosuccinate lyase